MKKYQRIITAITLILLFIILSACADGNRESEAISFESGMLTISFEYEKQSGYATNQFAVWVEDMNGNYIQTLYATKFTASGGYKSRPDSISTWVEKSNLASIQKSDLDAISGATPRAGGLSYYWNLKDTNGNTIPHGEYKFFVEGSLRWKNRVLYSGVITIGDTSTAVTADAEFIHEASDSQAALTSDSLENAMITSVTASYTPLAEN